MKLTAERAGEWLYPAAATFAVLYCVGCWLIYPAIVTFDGYVYLRLSKVLLTSAFPENWYFLRTPIYPLLIRVQDEIFGLSARSLTAINLVFNIATILLIGAVARRLAGACMAALAILLAALYPNAIGLSLSVLLESGTAFFLALFVYMSVQPVRPRSYWDAVFLALAVLLAYLYRQNLLYMLPFLGVIWIGRRMDWSLPLHRAIRSAVIPTVTLVFACLIIVGPVLAWWGSLERRFPTAGPATIMIAGLIKQSVYSPDDPRLGAQAQQYSKDIASASADQGRMPTHGIPGMNYSLLHILDTNVRAQGASQLLDIVRERPGRYLMGVLRTSIFALNLREGESETGSIVLPTLRGATPEGRFFPGPPGSDAMVPMLTTQSYGRAIGLLQDGLALVFEVILTASMLASLICLLLAWRQRSFVLAAPALLIWGYLIPWILVVHPNDRYTFPIHAVSLICFVIVIRAFGALPAMRKAASIPAQN